MEDAHIAEPELYAQTTPTKEEEDRETIPLPGHSLFAVFDGHGGTFAAEYAGMNLCRVLSRQPKFIQYARFVQERKVKEASFASPAKLAQYIRSGIELLEAALRDTFVDIDCEILKTLHGEQQTDANTPYHPSTDPNHSSDPAAPTPNEEEDSGSTAVVVILTPEWVICANAGDSRAVFSKSGSKAVPLSYDHKPDDEEEERRIRAAGGYVAGGRVEGDLAVSRGLGDYRFKECPTVFKGALHFNNTTDHSDSSMVRPDDQKVSPIPDIIVQNRSEANDEFIIVACDGIWDVQTNYEAVRTVADIFAEGETDLGLASEEILDQCLRMGSKDNMTALIVKFPAQKIGEGGGVEGRRKSREAAQAAEANSGFVDYKYDDDINHEGNLTSQ